MNDISRFVESYDAVLSDDNASEAYDYEIEYHFENGETRFVYAYGRNIPISNFIHKIFGNKFCVFPDKDSEGTATIIHNDKVAYCRVTDISKKIEKGEMSYGST